MCQNTSFIGITLSSTPFTPFNGVPKLTPRNSMAAGYGLQCIYKEEFHSFFAEHQEDKDYSQLLTRMNVVDSNGESCMNEDQWEAASELFAMLYNARLTGCVRCLLGICVREEIKRRWFACGMLSAYVCWNIFIIQGFDLRLGCVLSTIIMTRHWFM